MPHKIIVIEGGKRVEQVQDRPAENTEWMLGWCREHIPGFKDMQDRALASRNGTIAQVKTK